MPVREKGEVTVKVKTRKELRPSFRSGIREEPLEDKPLGCCIGYFGLSKK